MDGLSIAASLAEIVPRIAEGIIRTIYQPDRMRFVLRLFSGQDVRLVIDLQEATLRIAEHAEPNPETPSTFVMLLRKHLRGGRILHAHQSGWDRIITLEIHRREGSHLHVYALIAELVGMRGNLHLLKEGRLIRSLRSDHRNQPGGPFHPLLGQDKVDPSDVTPDQLERWFSVEDVERALASKVEGIGRETAADLAASATSDDLPLEISLRLKAWMPYVKAPCPHVSEDGSRATFYPLPLPATPAESFQAALETVVREAGVADVTAGDPILQRLKRGIKKRKRTIVKLEDWLSASDEADRMQDEANLLMIHQAELVRGAASAVLVDPETEQKVSIRLDPSLSPIENAQALYQRAKRIRRGHPHVHARLRKIQGELSLLRKAADVYRATGELDAGVQALIDVRQKQRPPAKKAVPFRQVELEGYQIWVGKSARQNDALLKAASANDLWMHAKDYAGSHVVIRARGSESLPDAVIQEAARLAARYSKAEGERRVEVTMTRVKNVRKPKGAPAGLVNVRDTDTLTVELEEKESR